MTLLREISGQELMWVHPNPLTRAFELRSGTEVLATLRYSGAFGGSATGEVDENRWTFTWEGVVRPRIHVRAVGSDSDEATVTLPFLGWGGRPWFVRLADGRTLQWAATGWTDREYALTSADGVVFLRFKRPFGKPPYGRKGKREMRLEIAPVARSTSELPLLALLGRYLIR